MRQLTLHLRSGVTTVRDCAARGRTMFWVREAIRRGYFRGPAAPAGGTRDHAQRRTSPLVREPGRHARRDPPRGPHPRLGGRRRHQGGRLGRRHARRDPVPRLLHGRRAPDGGGHRARARAAHGRPRALHPVDRELRPRRRRRDRPRGVPRARRGPRHGRRGSADRPPAARPAGRREARRLVGLPGPEPAVERLGHRPPAPPEGRGVRAHRRASGRSSPTSSATSTTSCR